MQLSKKERKKPSYDQLQYNVSVVTGRIIDSVVDQLCGDLNQFRYWINFIAPTLLFIKYHEFNMDIHIEKAIGNE